MTCAGATREVVAKKLAEGLDATHTEFFQKDGIVTDKRTTIDYANRRAYVETAARLRGDLKQADEDFKQINNFLLTITDRQLADALLGKIGIDELLRGEVVDANNSNKGVPPQQ